MYNTQYFVLVVMVLFTPACFNLTPFLPVNVSSAGAQGPKASRPITVGPEVLVSAVMPSTPHVEPYIAVDPSEPTHLVAASIAVTGPGQRFRIVAYTSFDGARTWDLTNLSVLDNMNSEFAGDPWVAFGLHGLVFLSCVVSEGKRADVLVFKSSDRGRTWDIPVRVPYGEGGAFDRPVIAVDRTSGKYAGNVYILSGQNHVDELHENLFQPSFSRSTDSGISFSKPVWIRGTNLMANVTNIVIFDDGSIVVSYMDYATPDYHMMDTPRLWTSISTDGGLTFSIPHLVTEFHVAPLTRFESPGAGQEIAASSAKGPFPNRLYAVWTDYKDDGTDICTAYSFNKGLTWSTPIKVNDDKKRCDQALPVIDLNSAGTLAVAWSDRRASPNNNSYEIYFSASTDSGTTFLPNEKVSSVLSCPKQANRVSGQNHESADWVSQRWAVGGDYSGLAAGSNGRFYLCWSDVRTGVFQLWSSAVDVRRRAASSQ